MSAELLADLDLALGEGPRLLPDGTVLWVDLLHGEVYSKRGATVTSEHTFPHEVSTVLPWHRGFVVLGRTEILFTTPQWSPVDSVPLHEESSNLRCSDGIVLPDGSLLVGVVDRDLRPGRGSLLHLTSAGKILTVVESCTIPNGLGVLAGGQQVVWVDSPTGCLDVFDIDNASGALGNRRKFAEIPESWGVPDGLCTDAQGGVFVAMWGAGAVIHLNPEGAVDLTLSLPVPHVTAVAFDTDDSLLVTTASVLLDDHAKAATPGAGGLWRFRSESHGRTRPETYVATGPSQSDGWEADRLPPPTP